MVQAKPPGCAHVLPVPDGLTVHVVGRLTPAVLSFLLPVIRVLSSSGRRQALLYINDEGGLKLSMAVPNDVHRVHVRDSDSVWLRCTALFRALQQFCLQYPIDVVHVHGLLPAVAAARLLRGSAKRRVDVVFSPHSSRIFGWAVVKHAMFRCVRSPSVGSSAVRVLVNLQSEARLLAPFGGFAVQVIDCPVPPVFFDIPRNEGGPPLLISCNVACHRAAIDGFLRVAVLVNDDRLEINFNWIGNTEADAVKALQAAGVACFEPSNISFRADQFSTAWVYLATGDERGFPLHLVEAMAAGLPCVALDTEAHRSVVVQGETGYLYANVREMLERIGELVDSQQLRHKLGQNARRVAELRFSETVFQHRFWHAIDSNAKSVPALGHGVCAPSEPFG